MKSILDRSFKYIPAAKTDIRKTFARLRKQQKPQETNVIHAFVLKKAAK